MDEIITCRVYFDDSDPNNLGWAWRSTVDGCDESGELDCDPDVGIAEAVSYAVTCMSDEIDVFVGLDSTGRRRYVWTEDVGGRWV